MEQSLFFYFVSVGTLLILMRFVMVIVFEPLSNMFARFANDIRKKMKG